MKKSFHTKGILFLVVLGLIAAVGADAALFYAIQNKNVEVNSIVSQNDLLTAEQSQASSFESIAASTAADRAALDSYVLPKAGQVTFVSTLSDLAKAAGVTLTVSNLGAAADAIPASGTDYLTANLRIQGGWVQVFHFLMLVESTPYSVGVSTLEFQRDTASTKGVLWDGSFSIQVLTDTQ